MTTPNYDRLVSLLKTFGRFQINNELIYIGNHETDTGLTRILLDSFINENGDDIFMMNLKNLVKHIDTNKKSGNIDIRLKDNFIIEGLSTNNINNSIYLNPLYLNSNDIQGTYASLYSSCVQLVDFYTALTLSEENAYKVTIYNYINIPKNELYTGLPLFNGNIINMDQLRYINSTTTQNLVLSHAWLCNLLLNEIRSKEDVEGAKFFYRSPKIFFEMMRLFFNAILQLYNISIIQYLINKLQENLNNIVGNSTLSFVDMDQFAINYKNYIGGGSQNVISLLKDSISSIKQTEYDKFLSGFLNVGKMLDDVIYICEINVTDYENKIIEYENNSYNIKYNYTKNNLQNVSESMTYTDNLLNTNKNIINMYSTSEIVYRIAYYISIFITIIILIGIFMTLSRDNYNKIKLIIYTICGLFTFIIVFYIIEQLFIMNMLEEFENQIDSVTKMLDGGIRYLVHISEYSFYERTLLPALNKEYKVFSNVDIKKRFSYEQSKTYINDMLHNIVFFSSFTYFIISLCIVIMITYILYLSMPENQLIAFTVFILLFIVITAIYVWNINERKRNAVRHTLWKKPKYNNSER